MKKNKSCLNRSTLSLAIAAAIQVSLPAGVAAQEVDNSSKADTQIEVITVGARRREETLQDVPLSLTALTEESLKNAGLESLIDLQTVSPGLTIQEGVDDNTARFFIRGMGTATPTVGIEPSVPIYIDDIYVPSGLASNLDLFSLSRVEVLKGPQGTLYGRNSFGGAVKLYTKSVDVSETEGNLALTAGSFQQRNFKAEIRTPVIEDKLWIGAGIAHIERDGIQRLVNVGKDAWAEDSDILNLKLKWQVSDDFDINLSYDKTEKAAPAKAIKIRGDGAFNGGVAGLHPTAVGPLPQSSSDVDDIDSEVSADSEVDSESFSWKADWTVTDDMSLTYLGSYRDINNKRVFDIDGTAVPFLVVYEDYYLKARSHELQLSYSGESIELSTGVFYYKEYTDSRGTNSPQGFFTFLDDAGNPQSALLTDVTGRQTGVDIAAIGDILKQETESVAAYINATYEVSEELNVTAGLRYTKDDKSQYSLFPQTVFIGGGRNFTTAESFPELVVPDGATVISRCFGAGRADACAPSFTQDEYTQLTPELTVDYRPSDEILYYASYKQGFQAGTIFSAASAVPGAGTSTDSQVVDAFEAGFKGSWLDGSLQLNGAAFYYDYSDLIVSVQQPVALEVSATGFAGIPANAGAASTIGAELDLTYRPVEQLVLRASLAYTDLDIDEVLTANADGGMTNIADTFIDTHTLTPKTQGTLGAEYFIPTDMGEFRLFTNIAYRDDIGINAANAAESSGIGLVAKGPNQDLFISPSLTTVSAGITYKTLDEKWRIDLQAHNLTDSRRPVATIFSVPGFLGTGTQYNMPRTWSVTATYNF